jgi:menaquinol-cytochrome c reductase iron-sulfur subunit
MDEDKKDRGDLLPAQPPPDLGGEKQPRAGQHAGEGWSPQHEGTVEEHARRVARDPSAVSRRIFLFKLSLAINGLVGAVVAVPIVRYLLWPVRRKSGYLSWITLGAVEEFQPGDTRLVTFKNPFSHEWDGQTVNVACYVRRHAGDQFTVWAVNCAHLNCPVRWFPEAQLFMCPCHGGVYYSDGSRAAGPPERGLFEYPTRVENGKLLIDAGQMPTLSNEAKLVKGIQPCPGTKSPGTNAPTIG